MRIETFHYSTPGELVLVEVHECKCKNRDYHPDPKNYTWDENWSRTSDYQRLEEIRNIPGVKYASLISSTYYIEVEGRWSRLERKVLQAINSIESYLNRMA